MKNRVTFYISAFAISLLSIVLFSMKSAEKVDNNDRIVINTAYQPGEVLNYRIHYGIINAGLCNMTVSEPLTINNKSAYNLKVEGETVKSFDWAYKVRDKFESWVDVNSHAPIRYAKTVRENNYFNQDIAIYNHSDKWLKNKQGQIAIPQYTQDIASAIYYMRTLNYADAKIGATYPIDVYLDNKIYNLNVKYVGKEVIKSDIGKVRCFKIKPQLVVDRVFKSTDAMTVWVTDDENKVPVRIQTEIRVGSLKVDLVKYQNLKNPMTSLVAK